jgi:hypothetical protein
MGRLATATELEAEPPTSDLSPPKVQGRRTDNPFVPGCVPEDRPSTASAAARQTNQRELAP